MQFLRFTYRVALIVKKKRKKKERREKSLICLFQDKTTEIPFHLNSTTNDTK